MLLHFSAKEAVGEGVRVGPHGLWRQAPCLPHPLLLTVHPQAELATSHKCLSHEVKRLTEENQGLRAEQPPSSALRGLEQDEAQEESLPSLVPVRGVWGPPRWPLASGHGRALPWDPLPSLSVKRK